MARTAKPQISFADWELLQQGILLKSLKFLLRAQLLYQNKSFATETRLGSPERGLVMYPLSDMVWGMFFRGVVFGFSAGFVLIILFLWGTGKYGTLAALRPIGFVYFLAGLEIGIALIGAIVFLGLHALQNWRHHMIDQSKQGSAS